MKIFIVFFNFRNFIYLIKCKHFCFRFNSPPNLKTATQLSRTQLKLQLMREQALQEQEKRQVQEKAEREQRPVASAMRVPLHSFAVDVPPQVLQVGRF